MKCNLSADTNKCPFCNKNKMECNYDRRCLFQETESEPVKETNGYVRKERWYEKYYR